jgi:hypothetical protein
MVEVINNKGYRASQGIEIKEDKIVLKPLLFTEVSRILEKIEGKKDDKS